MKPTLYTLGYQLRSPAEYFALLNAATIDVLIDVRDVPWSHKPGFAKAALSKAATDRGIEYVHAGFAGNPKRLRAKGKSSAELLTAYRGHLKEAPHVMTEFMALVEGYVRKRKRVCLICYERQPDECHRSVLASRWSRRTGGKVVHLGVDPELDL